MVTIHAKGNAMIDRTTKLLLLAIAAGLWMNVASQWLRPIPVHAAGEVEQTQSIERYVRQIANGLCLNSKIC